MKGAANRTLHDVKLEAFAELKQIFESFGLRHIKVVTGDDANFATAI
jgi:hypothetical protein